MTGPWEDLFDELAELPAAERAGRLDQIRRESPQLAAFLAPLLAADESTPLASLLERAPLYVAAALERADADPPPAVIGPYRIDRLLGRGGMGEVFLAGRSDGEFEHRVALKRIRSGIGSRHVLERFLRERQILAGLDHPGIARLLDGGRTPQGDPYLVMEYVDGESITEWCRRRGAGLEERLRLFRDVAAAVDSAHRQLVVHRDLKPSNIFVSADGNVKLLDFGIAKILAPGEEGPDVTLVEERRLTPAYAAPEQILGAPASTETDVFALGAVLFEILAGRAPFARQGKTLSELVRGLDHERPDRLSVVAARSDDPAVRHFARRLRGDLDDIVAKALEADRARRYPSAAALSDDLENFLVGLPVVARGRSFGYRAAKLVRRHRLTFAVGALGLAGIVAFGFRLATERDLARREADRAEAQRAIAESSRREAEQVTDLLIGIFGEASPLSAKAQRTCARDIFDAGARRLDAELASQPAIHAALQSTMARVYSDLDFQDEAATLAERALSTRETLFGPHSDEAIDSRLVLAGIRTEQADYAAAHEILTRALDDSAALHGVESEKYATALHGLGVLHLRQAHETQARETLEKELALREALGGGDTEEVASVLNALAIVARRLDDPERAEALYRRAIEIRERTLGPHHPHLGMTLNNLGVLLSRTGRWEEAKASYLRALAIYEKAYGPDHDLVAGTLDNLGEVWTSLKRPEEGIPYTRRALAYREKNYGPLHPSTGTTLNTLADALRQAGHLDEARPLFERSIAAYTAGLGPDSYWLAWPLTNLGDLYLARAEPDQGRPLLERALELRRKAWGEDHSLVAQSLGKLGRFELDAGRPAAAIPWLRQAAEVTRRLPASQQYGLRDILELLAQALRRTGATEEAATVEQQAAGLPSRPR